MTTQSEMQNAYALLESEIIIPAFVEKVAQHGIVLSTPEDVQRAWNIGQRLSELEQVGMAKKASSHSELVKIAGERLDAFCSEAGLDISQTARHDAVAVQAMQNPQIKQAAAVFCQALAAQPAA